MTSPATATDHAAALHLAACDPDWGTLIALIGPRPSAPPNKHELYESLINAVAHQQIHGRAAQAVIGRFLALYPDARFPSPEQILATNETALRACGFSFTKIAAIRGIAEKALDGTIPTRRAAHVLSDEELIERLITLRGVGRWTVEMLLITTLQRPDVLPVDDFAVREGWRAIKGLHKQPTPKELATIGLAWSPHRSIAAWYLWRAADRYKLVTRNAGSAGRAAK